MADFFSNIARQVLRTGPELWPLLPPRFAPWPGLPRAGAAARNVETDLFPPALIDPDQPAAAVPLPTFQQMAGLIPGPSIQPGQTPAVQDAPEAAASELPDAAAGTRAPQPELPLPGALKAAFAPSQPSPAAERGGVLGALPGPASEPAVQRLALEAAVPERSTTPGDPAKPRAGVDQPRQPAPLERAGPQPEAIEIQPVTSLPSPPAEHVIEAPLPPVQHPGEPAEARIERGAPQLDAISSLPAPVVRAPQFEGTGDLVERPGISPIQPSRMSSGYLEPAVSPPQSFNPPPAPGAELAGQPGLAEPPIEKPEAVQGRAKRMEAQPGLAAIHQESIQPQPALRKAGPKPAAGNPALIEGPVVQPAAITLQPEVIGAGREPAQPRIEPARAQDDRNGLGDKRQETAEDRSELGGRLMMSNGTRPVHAEPRLESTGGLMEGPPAAAVQADARSISNPAERPGIIPSPAGFFQQQPAPAQDSGREQRHGPDEAHSEPGGRQFESNSTPFSAVQRAQEINNPVEAARALQIPAASQTGGIEARPAPAAWPESVKPMRPRAAEPLAAPALHQAPPAEKHMELSDLREDVPDGRRVELLPSPHPLITPVLSTVPSTAHIPDSALQRPALPGSDFAAAAAPQPVLSEDHLIPGGRESVIVPLHAARRAASGLKGASLKGLSSGEPEPVPTVRVSIGRVVVRAALEARRPSSKPLQPRQPSHSLDDYLKGRQGDEV
jgi:hypothetical protein